MPNRRSFIKAAPLATVATGFATGVANNALATGLGNAVDLVNWAAVPNYKTVKEMSSLSIPGGTNAIRVSGYYTAGDGGEALYRRVASQPVHAGKFQTSDGAWWELASPLHASMFGVMPDGVTNCAEGLAQAIAAAQFLNQPLELPVGDIAISTILPTIIIQPDIILDIWSRGKSRLLIGAGSPVAINFSGVVVAVELTLTAAVAWGDVVINVDDASLARTGDILHLKTDTPVERSYGYCKQMLGVIASITGNAITLVEPTNFDFSRQETAVSISRSGTLRLRGVSWKCALGKRIDFRQLRGAYICDATLEGTGVRHATDCLFLSICEGTRGERLRLTNGRYAINVSNASRNSEFSDIYAEGLQHPIDANTWAYNTNIKRISGLNNTAIVECHPSFETKIEDVVDIIAPDQGASLAGLRCFGGYAKRVKSVDTSAIPVGGGGGVISFPAYRYLGKKYDRVYEDIVGLRGGLGAREVNGLYIRRCTVNSIDVDITDLVNFVEVDETTTSNIVNIRRIVQRTAPRAQPIVLPAVDEWGARGTVIDIMAVTNSDPGVVVAIAHGRRSGDVVRINGVVGMTQLNKCTFNVTRISRDAFALSGVDTSAYAKYVSGGRVAPGVIMKSICVKRVPYVGWHPVLHYEAVLHRSNSPNGGRSLTIPFKLKHNYGIQELGSGYRELELSIKAFSRDCGNVTVRYMLSEFQGMSSFVKIGEPNYIGSTGVISAKINNVRPHFATQVMEEGGDIVQDYDQFYLTADVNITVEHPNDIVDIVLIEAVERRIGLI
jgi:hypothetical protein